MNDFTIGPFGERIYQPLSITRTASVSIETMAFFKQMKDGQERLKTFDCKWPAQA